MYIFLGKGDAMILEYIDGDNSRESIAIEKNIVKNDGYIFLNKANKKEYILAFIASFLSLQKMVIYDKNHTQLADYHKRTNLDSLNGIESLNAQLLFFTSGSSGFPVGAFKSTDNLLSEVEVLKALVCTKKISRVIVTVPFVHIYGVIAGILLPLFLEDVVLVIKEDFLPYELLEEALKGESLIITTPVFIKALTKLSEEKDLSSSTFISSTGPLHSDDVYLLEQKYKTSLLQIFGSTETGGIGYKKSVSSLWIPLDKVSVESEDDKLKISSPFLSEYILNDGIQKLDDAFVTEDIIKLEENGFELLGRSNKIIKIAGKRISAVAIENLLEELDGVKKVIVSLVYKKELLRSEQILIKMESSCEIKKSIIKNKISQIYGILTIPFKVEYVDKINTSSMGKKIIF